MHNIIIHSIVAPWECFIWNFPLKLTKQIAKCESKKPFMNWGKSLRLSHVQERLNVTWEITHTYPILGPPCVKSKTWRGLRSHWNFWSSLAPWLPPLFGLINTSTGVMFGVGIGFITNVRNSFSLDFFLPAGFFFGVFRSDDLKLPRRGSFTIHEGGTIIREWTPVKSEHDSWVWLMCVLKLT